MDFSRLKKGSLLIPLRNINFNLLKEGDFQVVKRSSGSPTGILKRLPGVDFGESILLLGAKSMNGVLELECLARQQTARVYLEEKDFNELFAPFPAKINEEMIYMNEQEEWLNSKFRVRGQLFTSANWRRPQVIKGDYEALRARGFMTEYGGGFRSTLATEGLGETSCIVLGHAIRIRGGARNLVFQFFRTDTGEPYWWEFNNVKSPRGKSRLFRDHWLPSDKPYEPYPRRLCIKKLG